MLNKTIDNDLMLRELENMFAYKNTQGQSGYQTLKMKKLNKYTFYSSLIHQKPYLEAVPKKPRGPSTNYKTLRGHFDLSFRRK